MELYIDMLGGLDLDGSTDKNLPYFVVDNLAALPVSLSVCLSHGAAALGTRLP